MNSFVLYFVSRLMRCIEFLLFARAIASWFPQAQGSKLYEFLYAITEPIVLPFRKLLQRFEGLRQLPIDLSSLMALLSVELILMLLYSL